MKTLRTDLTALGALALVVAAVVVLVVTDHPVPDWLQALGATLAAAYVGLATPTRVQFGSTATEPAPEPSPAPAAQPAAVLPSPAPAAQPAAVLPSPAPAPLVEAIPGRDWTETFPAITPAMIAADRAGQQ